MENDKRKSPKSHFAGVGLTVKGLRVLLAFSFVVAVLGFTVAYCEHRQYTELVGRYDTAIEKMSEYEASVAELMNRVSISEQITQYVEPQTTFHVTEDAGNTTVVDSTQRVTDDIQTANTKPQTTDTQSTTAQQPTKETTTQLKETTAAKEISSTYYVTLSGKKYHVASCSYLSKSKIAITMDRIKAEGYSPCSRCIK